MENYRKGMIVGILMLVFTTWFLHNTKRDFNLIFQKDLLAHDESSNSVVAVNLTRKFFPPMVRVNPLVDQQGNWMEGPFWQHIPPLFAYVPYIFFKLDGQVTIEVKRLSYAFITLLTGLLFIFGVYKFRKSLLAAGAATVAAIFWINTPFTHELITSYAFGASDIVLAFTVVAGFAAILWYLKNEQKERLVYPYWKLAVVGVVVALPIMAKNLLGAIPAATFFILLLYDQKKVNKSFFISFGSFAGILFLYFFPLLISSPATFTSEILVSFWHFNNLEGWGRAWHWYVSNYLPLRYLGGWTWVYFIGLIGGLMYYGFRRKQLARQEKILLTISGGWFLWNLVAISFVTSKVPNFIYQSYLLSIFFVIYIMIEFARSVATKQSETWNGLLRFARKFVTVALIISILVTGYEVVRFAGQFKVQRAQAYNYQTEHEKFYGMAEIMQGLGLNTKDLVIVRISDNDCWFRYYPLFLTGTETKTLLEMSFGFDPNAIKRKYTRMYFVVNKDDIVIKALSQFYDLPNYSLVVFDLRQFDANQIENILQGFISFHQSDIDQDIKRIKKDKTSCQWLVPDPILNAP